MSNVIEVRDVIETNDCAGKKSFFVTSMASDELIESLYRLNHAWMPPDMKLELASVAPMDKVRIYHPPYIQNLLHEGRYVMFAGDFVENLSDTHFRDPVCICGTRLVSDGFDIHCPNLKCILTIKSRLERLANTDFFDYESITNDGELISFNFGPTEFESYAKPFKVITQGLFWGLPGSNLQAALLRERVDPPSIATFLVPELLEGFLENPGIPSQLSEVAIPNIKRFYGLMNETVNRRDFYSIAQKKLLSGFLWSLGIESLKPHHFESIFNYEAQAAFSDPAVIFAYLLTHPDQLVHELGLHPLEAGAIVTEISRRKYELHDVFLHYALNRADITASFSHLM